MQGTAQTNGILSAVGALFVAPFLLFSSAAGILADRFSKQKLLLIMKIAEMIIMGLALVAVFYKSEWGCYFLLFLLASHSALFGPSKYGIIPELVMEESVSKANGLITSFTYLAIIIGTFLAAFLTDITNRNFVIVVSFCFFFAVAGFLSAFGIKQTPSQKSNKKFNFFFIREIYKTLVFSREKKHLFNAILGAAYFLFVGAYTQLNIIPFAMESLHLSEVAGGYLFLSTALGIACGSIIAGKLSKKRIELGLSCIAGIAIAFFMILLSFFPSHLSIVVSLLVLIGIAGGAFIVPFESFIQVFSPNEKRGQVIAATNFLSFTGVLLASFAIYLFGEVFKISSAKGFGIIGLITFFVSCRLIMRLSDSTLSYFSRKILRPLFPFQTVGEELVTDNATLVMQKTTWLQALLLLSLFPNIHFILHKKHPWFKRPFYSIHVLSPTESPSLKEGEIPCFLLESSTELKGQQPIFVHFEKSNRKRVVRFCHSTTSYPIK